jgi:hypothetical protein
MKTWIIVKKEDLTVQGSYEAMAKDDSSANRSYLVAEPICAHVEMPEGLDKDCLRGVMVPESGTPGEEDYVEAHMSVEEDPAKVEEKLQRDRDMKLAMMRQMRDEKMLEVDVMVNELTLGDRTDTAAVQLYRSQLKGITDNYKDEQDDMKGTDALDALEADLSDLMWPTAP